MGHAVQMSLFSFFTSFSTIQRANWWHPTALPIFFTRARFSMHVQHIIFLPICPLCSGMISILLSFSYLFIFSSFSCLISLLFSLVGSIFTFSGCPCMFPSFPNLKVLQQLSPKCLHSHCFLSL